MTKELKPCPFCGSRVHVDHGDSNMPFLFFRCFKCGAVVSFANELYDAQPELAKNAWNTGLYSLILSSKLPTAKQFKHWVTSEVLPSIRKTGSYNVHKDNGTGPSGVILKAPRINKTLAYAWYRCKNGGTWGDLPLGSLEIFSVLQND